MTKHLKSLLIVLLLGGVSTAAWFLATRPKEKPPSTAGAETVVNVRAQQVFPGARRPLLFLIGEVEARDYVAMSAPLSAEVLKIAAREGEFFRQGTRLFILDLREQELRIDIQQSAVDEIRLQRESLQRNQIADSLRLVEIRRLLTLAQTQYDRDRELLSKDVITTKQLQSSEQSLRQRRLEFLAMENQLADYGTQIKRLQTQLAAAESQLAQTKLLLERAKMRAPFSGRVAKLKSAVGARPASNEPLIEIFDPAHLRLRTALPQRYSALATAAADALLKDNDGQSHVLPLSGFEPSVEKGGGSIDVFFDLPGDDWVLGSTWQTTFRLPPLDGVISLPIDAVYGDNRVYRIDAENRARRQICERVGVAADDDGKTAALLRCPTLSGGDSVITNQLPNIVDSVKVRVIAQ